MGLFFESAGGDAVLEDQLDEALAAPGIDADNDRRVEARRRSRVVQAADRRLKPKPASFVSAAAVFLALAALAFASAWAADAQSVPDAQLGQLSDTIRSLLAAWSGAVLGLVGGEAVGKKS